MMKPVAYGSAAANGAFLALIWLHVVGAAIVVGAVAGVMITRKGSFRHRQFGKAFLWATAAIVLSGVIVDLIRLIVFVEPNHTKYAALSMPSTYPARFAFLYAGLCIPVLLIWGRPGLRAWRGEAFVMRFFWPLVAGLGLIGLALTVVIFTRYNPWTGALWLIWAFMAMLAFMGAFQAGVARGFLTAPIKHRFAMLAVAGFIIWGAIQGFVPAVDVHTNGVATGTGPYVGDQPGAYSPAFFGFLVWFLPPFAVCGAAFLWFSVIAQKAR